MKVPSGSNKTSQSSLIFGIAEEEYAINILLVQELCGYGRVTQLANSPAYLMGVVNLRGVIVPLIDLRVRFGVADPSYNASTVVVILILNGRTTGIVVDSVSDVVTLEPEQIKPPPEVGAVLDANLITGIASVGDRMLILLDIHRMLAFDDLATPAQLAS